MALQDRVRKYTERGFQRADAEILVLIEESAIAIFTTFPDRFILFGGATLIHLLVHQGAALDDHLLAHLEDFTLIKELDREFITGRIEKIVPKLCTVELRAVLPLPVFEELAKKEFEPIRHSLRTALSHCLGEAAQ